MENLTLAILKYNEDGKKFYSDIQECNMEVSEDNYLAVRMYDVLLAKYRKQDLGRIKHSDDKTAIYLNFADGLGDDYSVLLDRMKESLLDEAKSKSEYLLSLISDLSNAEVEQ